MHKSTMEVKALIKTKIKVDTTSSSTNLNSNNTANSATSENFTKTPDTNFEMKASDS